MSRSLTIVKIDGKPGQVYYPLQLNTNPKPVPGPGELLIRLHATALNHRDHFIRQHLYPGLSFDNALLADGSGNVVEAGPGSGTALLHQRVILTPMRSWAPTSPSPSSLPPLSSSSGANPLANWIAIGGITQYAAGAAQDYICVPESEVEACPAHLSAAEAAALPLVGLTGWRALVSKGGCEKGQNVLVTGIGGGVALAVLQFGVAMGANVYVTSGSQEKLDKAKALGAAGGVSYKEAGWEKKLAGLLPESRPYLDIVVDGAGGDIVSKTVRLLKPNGVIAIYGMTVAPKMEWSMQAVMKNVDLRGCTMGSRDEFRDMVAFVREHGVRPVVSRVVRGLDNLDGIDGLFADMRDGRQFGKLVIEIAPESEGEAGSKL
ncbi:Uu.00g043720.m01.CDS01 [Anthostomella pinea]|uniref:Uu.00g043720.m01.CDS01 n=1 Tax=Anthostomella pinea TaxID=933095 RepID=A0AAI8VAQ8_9PEZI|nr:Uu.00g043720.m01.CDS01 [Anthostomella pinea]